MSIITRMRKQRAVWWKRLLPDRYGKYSFDPPIEIACRWDDVNEVFVDSKGEERASRALVYVDRVVSPGDRLMLGEMDSGTAADPLQETQSYEVARVDSNPNFKATEFLRVAYL